MIDVFYIGQGRTLPAYPFVVRNASGVVDLSALGVSAVYFAMARVSTGSVVVSYPAVITNAAAGEGEYRWSIADTAATGDFAASLLFKAAAGDFELPHGEMAKIVVEDRFAIGSTV